MTTFELPTSGTTPKFSSKQALDDEVNRVIQEMTAARTAGDNSLHEAIIAGDDAHSEGTYYAGPWDASIGSFPSARTQGGSIQNGDYFEVSVSGVVDGTTFNVGERIKSLIDDPSTTTLTGNWYHATINAELSPLSLRVGYLESIKYQVRDQSTADEVSLLPNNTIFEVGGLKYQRDDTIPLSLSAFGDFSVSGIKPYGLYSVLHFGCVGDSTTDNSINFQRAINAAASNIGFLYIPVGSYYVSQTLIVPDYASSFFTRSGVTFAGESRTGTEIITDQDIALIDITDYTHFRHLTLRQSGTEFTGSGIYSSTQVRFCEVEDVNIISFKFGEILRFSLWCAWRDVYFVNNACGLKLARNDDMENQANPSSTGSWNQVGGWFHNQLTFDNVLCNGGEVGIWGSCMGATFNNVTCQNQEQLGALNVTLPIGQKGIGIWLQGGGSGSSDSFNNVLINYYTEDTLTSLKVSNCRETVVNGWFAQGRDSSYTLLDIDDGKIWVNGQTSQSPFGQLLLADNASEVVGDGHLSGSGGSITLNGGSLYNPWGFSGGARNLGDASFPINKIYTSGDAFFGTTVADPKSSSDDGVVLDKDGIIYASRNGHTLDLNSRGTDGYLARFSRSNAFRGGIKVTNARGGAIEYHTTSEVIWTSGEGSPEGSIVAPKGSLYTRTNGAAGETLYVKQTGAGNTGWVVK